MGLSIDDVHAAARRLRNRIHRTPVVSCQSLDDATGLAVFLKCEDRQRDDREAVARALAEKTNRVIVPPFDDYAIMAGQGTAALELFQDVPSLDALLTPVGGGGLMAGCATVARTLFPGIQIFGVETETANDTHLSLRKGERVTIPPPPTIADGIRLTTPGALTFPILQRHLTDMLLVSDAEVRTTVRFLALRARIVVEPTGAVPAAAVLSGRLPLARGARVGVVLSGGNIEPSLLIEILKG